MLWLNNPNRPWGYTIYRTVYTEHSSQVWSTVIEKFHSYLFYSVKKAEDVDLHCMSDELLEAYNVVVFNDASKFDGMSIRRVRRHWLKEMDRRRGRGWRRHEDDEDDDESSDSGHDKEDDKEEEKRVNFIFNHTKLEFCILIDEEVLQSILDAPATPKEASEIRPNPFESIGYIKVADQISGPARSADYPGWMKVDLRCLWELYHMDEPERHHPYINPDTGERFVYNGMVIHPHWRTWTVEEGIRIMERRRRREREEAEQNKYQNAD